MFTHSDVSGYTEEFTKMFEVMMLCSLEFFFQEVFFFNSFHHVLPLVLDIISER